MTDVTAAEYLKFCGNVIYVPRCIKSLVLGCFEPREIKFYRNKIKISLIFKNIGIELHYFFI